VDGAAVGEEHRWDVLWIHYESEELRVHHRTTVSATAARGVVVAVLASGRVPPMQTLLLGSPAGGVPALLQRFWGTVVQHDATTYWIVFINDRCIVFRPA
jgi:hypothetical protein